MAATLATTLALFMPTAVPAEDGGSSPTTRPGEAVCHTRACDRRVQRKRRQRRVQKRHKAAVRWRAHQRLVVNPHDAKLNRIATCESGQRWHIATGNGFFGGLQFTIQTWKSVGGPSLPHYTSELEQKYRAVLVYNKRRGSWADWPICGFR